VIAVRKKRGAGFTLVEILVALGLSSIVMLGVFSSYIFIARHLVRLSNQQAAEVTGRRILNYFAKDMAEATGIDTSGGTGRVSPTATGVSLVIPTSTGTTYVTYSYYDPNPNDDVDYKILERNYNGTKVILGDSTTLSNVDMSYFTVNDTAIYFPVTTPETPPVKAPNVAKIALFFTVTEGDLPNVRQTMSFSTYLTLHNRSLLN
jgi:prepilin-type N-terminal cleavage/methylation domain-containing protein